MQLHDFKIFQLHIPFKSKFSHTLASRSTSESVLLVLADTQGNVGYGEATPRPYVTGESVSGTMQILLKVLNEMGSKHCDSIEDLDRLLKSVPGLERAPSARCALELALLDLLGKNLGRPVLPLLGVSKRENVFYSAVISSETSEKVEQIARQVAAMNVRQVKLKVGADREINRKNILVLREILGDDVEIRVDANAAWTFGEAVDHIGALVAEGVCYVEQPLPAGDRNIWLALQQRIPAEAQVYVDESVCTLDDASWMAERRAVSGFNLKISKHGGILPTLEVYRIAQEHGLFCQLGCHVGETSILSAAGRILAALAGNLRACEGSYGKLLMEHDLTDSPWQVGYQGIGAMADLLKATGLGVQVNLNLVEAYLEEMPESGEQSVSH
jgi:L-Ala-D/L-Glu epimerase